MKKTEHFTKEELEDRDKHMFNDGRLHCDSKWINAIKERIEVLEKSVGIPELRKLEKDFKYRWKED